MGQNSKAVILAVLLLALIVLGGYNLYVFMTPVRPDIVIIGVESLRADHMSLYGYEKATTPNIDKFAENATVFDNCLVPSTLETPSIASMWTGVYPDSHTLRGLRYPLPATESTMAEILQDFGYLTVAFQGNPILGKILDQGFSSVKTAQYKMSAVGKGETLFTPEPFDAATTTDEAIALLEGQSGKDTPVMLWILYNEPQLPYAPAEVKFAEKSENPDVAKIADSFDRQAGEELGDALKTEPVRRQIQALYDSEVSYTDQQIGRLLDYLREKYPDAIIILTADHGENLGETPGVYGHGDLVDQPALHVPLVISGLNFGGQTRIAEPVSTLDILPTILSHLMISVKGIDFEGVDLVKLAGGGADGRVIFSEGRFHLHPSGAKGEALNEKTVPEHRVRCATKGNLRAVISPFAENPAPQIFDIAKDPYLLNPLGDIQGPEASSLIKALQNRIADDNDNPKVSPSDEDIAALTSVGYY